MRGRRNKGARFAAQMCPTCEENNEKDDQVAAIVRFLLDAGWDAAAAAVEIEFGRD